MEFNEEKLNKAVKIVPDENPKRTENDNQHDEALDSTTNNNNFVLDNATNQRTFRPKRRRRMFCDDVIFESVQFLQLPDLLRVNTANRRVLARPCQLSLKRLDRPRIVGPLYINQNGIHRHLGQYANGRQILEPLPFPQIPPPTDKILGFGRIIVDFQEFVDVENYNRQHLDRVGYFLCVSERLLREHDLLLESRGWKTVEREFILRLAEIILSQLKGRVRTIREMDIFWLDAALLRNEVFLATNRLLFTNPQGKIDFFGRSQFEACVDWLHFQKTPATDNDDKQRTLIFCTCSDDFYFTNIFIPMVVKRFQCPEIEKDNNKGLPSPKFCVIVLFHESPWFFELTGHYLINEERGDALSLEPICCGEDRSGRPFSEFVSWDPAMKHGWNSLARFFERCFNWGVVGTQEYFPNLSGFILRRDVAIGPWTKPVLIEAQRYYANPREEKVLHLIWS